MQEVGLQQQKTTTGVWKGPQFDTLFICQFYLVAKPFAVLQVQHHVPQLFGFAIYKGETSLVNSVHLSLQPPWHFPLSSLHHPSPAAEQGTIPPPQGATPVS